jgi:hypothetical protein
VDNFCPVDKSFEQSGPDASRSVHVSPTHNFWPWHWFHGCLTRTKFVILYIAKSIIQLFIWYGDASLGIHDRLPYNIWLLPYFHFHSWTILFSREFKEAIIFQFLSAIIFIWKNYQHCKIIWNCAEMLTCYVRSFTNDPSLVPVGQINWVASGASRDIFYGPLALCLTQPYHSNYWS